MAIEIPVLGLGIRNGSERKGVPTVEVAHVSEAVSFLKKGDLAQAWVDIDKTTHLKDKEVDLASLAAVTVGLRRHSARILISESHPFAQAARVLEKIYRRNTNAFPFITPSLRHQVEKDTTQPSFYGLQKLLPAQFQRRAWRESRETLDNGGHIAFIGDSRWDANFARAAHTYSERTGSGRVTFIHVKP